MGLVNRVVPAADLRDEVMGLARGIAQNAPLTVAACKAAIREAGRPPAGAIWPRVESMIEACFASEDYHEGQRALPRSARPPSPGADAAPGAPPQGRARRRAGSLLRLRRSVVRRPAGASPAAFPPSGTLPGPPAD